MIKQATLFKATTMPSPDFKLVAALQAAEFQPCLPSQSISSGWTAPNGDELCIALNGQLIMQYTTETKKIPADILKRALAKRCKDIEALTGRNPGMKEKKEIKQEIFDELIIKAFPTRTSTKCWINPINQMAVIDAAPKRAHEVATALIQTIDGLVLDSLQIQPAGDMAYWLAGLKSPEFVTIGIDCELISTDGSKTKVKYVRHNLDIPEIVDHVTAGMRVKSLSLLWGDRVSFTLNDDMSLSKIEFLEVPEIEDAKDSFEVDAYLATTEINNLAQDLIEELS